MAARKYEKYIITKKIPTPPPPASFLKRMEEQRKAGNYTESTHMFQFRRHSSQGGFLRRLRLVMGTERHGRSVYGGISFS